MLHILNSTEEKIVNDCLALCAATDEVILIAEAAHSFYSCNEFTRLTASLSEKAKATYIINPATYKAKTDHTTTLTEHLPTPINYDAFVTLTAKADKVLSWY